MVTVGKKKKHHKPKGKSKEIDNKFSKAVHVSSERQELVFDYDTKVVTWNTKVNQYKEAIQEALR